MRIAVAGGDLRMLTVCKLLAEHGFECTLFGFGNLLGASEPEFGAAVNEAAAVILPLPFSKGGNLYAPFCEKTVAAEEALALCGNNSLILVGGTDKEASNTVDYSRCETLLLKNAFITAEAALSIAMNEMKRTVFGSQAVILGYGRIGSFLAKMCRSLGARVSVVARKSEARALAEASGMNALPFCEAEKALSTADTVFNTVPSLVLDRRALSAIGKQACVIELASLPGGIDREEARRQHVKVIEALGLPGKYAPASAGSAIAETIIPILLERGITP